MTMDAAPFFSVIIPARNAEDSLGTAVSGILSQSFDDLELIIVVNASSDGTAALAGRYRLSDPRVRLLETDVPGAANARNIGLDAAAGRYVIFCDADDTYLPGALSCFAEALDRDPVDMLIAFSAQQSQQFSGELVCCTADLVRNIFLDEPRYAPELGEVFAGRHLFLRRSWAMAYSRKLPEAEKIRFDTRWPTLEIIPFILRFTAAARTAAFLDMKVYSHNRNEGSLSERRNLEYMRDVACAMDLLLEGYCNGADRIDENCAEPYSMLFFHMLTHMLRVTASNNDPLCREYLRSFMDRGDVDRMLRLVRCRDLDVSEGINSILMLVLKALREGNCDLAGSFYAALTGEPPV